MQPPSHPAPSTSLSLEQLRTLPFARPLVLGAGTDLLRPDRTFLRRRLAFAELWWILDGSGQFGVDEQFFTVRPGDLILHRPFQSQSGLPDAGSFLRYHWIHLDVWLPDPLPEWSQAEWNARVELRPESTRWRPVTVATPPFLHPATGAELQLLFAHVIDAFRRGESGAALASALCQQLLLAIADECCPPPPPTPEATQRAAVQRVLAYIHRHYARPLSLAELGEVACLHPVYLGTVFKRHTGDTPIEHLHRVRIQSAQTLLRTHPERTIASIAEEVGFTSTPHFHRIFKRLTGTTPDACRRAPRPRPA